MNKTEKDVAKELGISQAYLSQILRGKRKSVKIREKIDKLFKKESKKDEKIHTKNKGSELR